MKPKKNLRIALAGNPNSGKTTLFNAITGARHHVGNWPGVTVEKKEGYTTFEDREITVVDLPGTYSLTAYSIEEIVARRFIVHEKPDVVIIATGGQLNGNALDAGNELVVTSWDIISGDVKPGSNVLIYDDAGDHPALQAAEVATKGGAKVEMMTPQRAIAAEVMGMNLVPYMRTLQGTDFTTTVGRRLKSVARQDNQLSADIGTDYSDLRTRETYDQVVVNHGTIPLDELYFELKPLSSNLGEVDYDAFIGGRPQTVKRNEEGTFQLFRIGDAVAARDTHAAIYDALRLVKEI